MLARLTLSHALVEYESEFFLARRSARLRRPVTIAEVAELADAHGSGPCTRKGVGVRVPSSAPANLRSFPGSLCSRVRISPAGSRFSHTRKTAQVRVPSSAPNHKL